MGDHAGTPSGNLAASSRDGWLIAIIAVTIEKSENNADTFGKKRLVNVRGGGRGKVFTTLLCDTVIFKLFGTGIFLKEKNSERDVVSRIFFQSNMTLFLSHWAARN